MTEGSFIQEKNRLRANIAIETERMEAARRNITLLEDDLIKLMGAASQEPWWGEAND